MGKQVTLNLPDDVLERAESVARHLGRPVSDFLAEAIELSLRPLGEPGNGQSPIAAWSNEEVLVATETELPPNEDERLSILLDQQQAGTLSPGDQSELSNLFEKYQAGLLRKAQALHEAVKRGLREPLQP